MTSGNLRRRAHLVLFALVLWLCPGASLLGEDTHLTDYAKGCRALRFFGWQKAAFWFREALAERPEPFGHPVPWSNTKSQLYLPRYVLGVSLFGLGNYDEALEEWRRAEEEWSGLDGEKKRALEPYLAVIREGRDIYRGFVCAEILPPASGGGENESARLREEARTLCDKGHFSAAVKRVRNLVDPAKFVHDSPVLDSLSDLDAVETIENVPVAFAQEISDCEAPDKLKPWAHLTSLEGPPNRRDGAQVTTRLPALRHAVLGPTISTTILTVSKEGRGVVAGGPTMADLLKSVDKVYAKKFALLISPDYKGTPWGNIKGAEEAIRLLESGLLRWGFKQENIVLLHGYVKAGDLEQQIRSFIRKNASYGDHARNLVLIHFLGHAYRRDEDDNGVLVASDSPQPQSPSDMRGLRDLMDKSVEAGIVMSFTNQAPHHLIFSFDSCSFGEPLFTPFEGMRDINWYTAQKNPALLLIARSAPEQIASERPALTEALGQELKGCGHGDPDGVATGWRLFSAVAEALHDKQINDSQTLKYGLHPQWRKGDVVLRVPADCKPAAKTPGRPAAGTLLNQGPGERPGRVTSFPTFIGSQAPIQ
jgi:tetratricopeptide (TPR) repeat protein